MNEIKVKHANELNRVPMRGFTATEMNLFFSLCAKMKDKGDQKIRFDFETLR
ncbi:RepB family plasmid replication initiator protein, partial [Salmonella enterica]|uniref:RepB family plasmid replication initiator protein n=1 Tax=Salmonella enterica TaxID=28901 RepID=UPI000CA95CC7